MSERRAHTLPNARTLLVFLDHYPDSIGGDQALKTSWKEYSVHTLKRSALYALVWSRPMTHLGKQLGISDVGLAKACRRYGIPVPPRGHWAKLAAGKGLAPAPLPEPEKDFEIALTTVNPQQRERHLIERQTRDAEVAAKSVQLAGAAAAKSITRQRVHPLIRTSRAFVARIPAMEKAYARARRSGAGLSMSVPYPPFVDMGRRILNIPEGLSFSVGDTAINWAIDWHEKLILILEPEGVRFSTGVPEREKHRQLLLEQGNEHLYLRMNESHKKQYKDSDEVENQRAAYERGWEWVASGRIILDARGTEPFHNQKWAGRQDELDRRVPEIAASLLAMLERQPHLRAERLQAQARAEEEARRQRRERDRVEALKAQVDVAVKACNRFLEEQRLRSFLDELDQRLKHFEEPGRGRLQVWIQMVRQQIDQDPPHLRILEEAIAGNRWNNDPPAWWPEEMAWLSEART